MPITWDEVAASDRYLALTPDQQARAKRQYFDQVVAPKVAEPKRATAWAQFEAYVPKRAAAEPAAAESGSLAGDMGRGVMSGLSQVPQLAAVTLDLPARWLRAGLRAVGADAAAERIQPLMETDLYRDDINPVLQGARESWREGMSAETRAEQGAVGDAIRNASDGTGGIADFAGQAWAGAKAMATNPRALAVTFAESAPDMLAGIGVAGAAGRAAAAKAFEQTGSLMLRAGASPQLAQRVAKTAAVKAASTPATLAAAGTEAAQATGYVLNDLADAIAETPDADMQEVSPRYAKLRQTLSEAQAKAIMASEAMDSASGVAFGTTLTGSLFTGAGAMMGRIGTGAAGEVAQKTGRSKLVETAIGAGQGAAREGAQEFVQGAGQKLAENVGMVSSGADPNRSLAEGVAASGGAEAVAGAAMGAPLGAYEGWKRGGAVSPEAGLASTTRTANQGPAATVSSGTNRDSTAASTAPQDSRGGASAMATAPGREEEIAAAIREIEERGTDENLGQAAGSGTGTGADPTGGRPAGDEAGQIIDAGPAAGASEAAGGEAALRPLRGEAGESQRPLDVTISDVERLAQLVEESGLGTAQKAAVQQFQSGGLKVPPEFVEGIKRSPLWNIADDGTVLGVFDAESKNWAGTPKNTTAAAPDVVPAEGLDLLHGSNSDTLTLNDIQIVRTSGQKQGKKGRVYGGLYTTDNAEEAKNYAEMKDGAATIYDVRIKPGTRIFRKDGDVTRLSKDFIDDLLSKGYGVVTGRSPIGRPETVVIDKAAIESFTKNAATALQLSDRAADQAATAPQDGLPAATRTRTPDPFRATKKPPKPNTSGQFADQARRTLLAEIRALGGIEQTEMADIAGEGRRNARGGVGTKVGGQVRALFTKNGVPLDRVRERLGELGYFGSDNDVTGDLQTVRDIIRAALDGDAVGAMSMPDRDTYEAMRIDERVAQDQAEYQHQIQAVEKQRLALQYEANDRLGEDVVESLSRRFETDDDSYYNALQEALDAQRKQDEGDGRSEDHEAAGRGAPSPTTPGDGVEVAGDREGRSGQAPGEVGREVAPPVLELETQTEADLARRAKLEADAEAAGRAETRRAADKAQADKDRDNFALTGSSRPADVAMAGGQRDLLAGARVEQSGTSAAKPNQPAVDAAETKADIPETEAGISATPVPGSATNADKTASPLHIEPFGAAGKLIIVRGDTKPNKDRIKAVRGALWNKQAGGWTFRADLEPAVRAALADLLAPAANRDSAAAEAGDSLESPEGKADGKSENAPEPQALQAGDGREDRRDGRAGEPGRGSLGQRMAEADPEAGAVRPADRGDNGADRAGAPRAGSRGEESLDGRDRNPPAGRPDGRPAGIVDEPAGDHVIADGDLVGEGGEKAKVRNNLAAIELAKQLAAEGRAATADERRVLSRYVGWGGLKRVFDPKMWVEGDRLRAVLTAEEYAAARASMLDAHYTSLPVVDAMWAAVQHLGFTGGRIVEPEMGTGNFFGRMPAAVGARSVLNGVEKDHITGLIASQLYQRAAIAVSGFEDVSYPLNSADLVIGNPPFGSQVLFDATMPEATRGFSIHNFFFAKAVEITRPGGLVAMVVSHSLLDAKDSTARDWIAARARLLGAVRLPYTAFLSNAGTEVVTDILFLQKLADGIEGNAADWTGTAEIILKAKDGTDRSFAQNAYFAAHPDMVLGTAAATGKMYGRPDQYNVEPLAGAVLEDQIAAAVKQLPREVFVAAEKPVDVPAMRDALVPEHTKPYGYFLAADGETVMQRVEDSFDGKPQSVRVDFKDQTSPRRAAGMIAVRDALRAQMRAEMTEGATASTLDSLRSALNATYDRFQKQYGYLNSQTNRRAFRDDPDLPLLESLEPGYDPGVSKDVAKKRDVAPRAATAGKADIFRRRVLAPSAEIRSVESAKDALVASLNLHGAVLPDFMSEIYGKDFEVIAAELGDLVYQNPDGQAWETAELYLSGNVKHKLKQARTAAGSDARFARNVAALEAVQPADVPALKIGVRLGSPWVPGEVIEDFARQLLGQQAKPVVRFVRAVGRWSVDILNPDQAASISRWGTERVPAAAVMSAVMNSKQILVKDNHGTSQNPVWVVNEAETEAARARAEEMAAKFKEWIWQDETRRQQLERLYNDGYNTDRRRPYDGSHLTLPGSRHAVSVALGLKPTDPGALILRQHQLNGIWRGVQETNVLLDHVVGAGKTFEMAAIALELRRLGISRKPTLAVPNHLVRQWRDEFYKLYPNANVLAATESDFEKKNRKRLFARIATGDWDAVIVGHSSFEKIGAPLQAQKSILDEQLAEISEAIEAVKRERGDRNVLRDMERIKQNLGAKLKALAAAGAAKDDVLDFGELGIDALFVDEAHLFKNLFYMSQMRGIAGLGDPQGSARAFDLFVKTRFLEQRYGKQSRVVFATGTPVSNSLVEMYTMQRYLAYPELQRRGIATLDAWAGVYGDVQNVYEVHPSGTGYRLKTRFAKFVNVPSLMELYRGFADVVSMDDLKEQAKAGGGRFPVPNVRGGKPRNVVAERSPQQTEFFGVPEFGRDESGAILFKYPADLRAEVNGEGKWVLVGSPSREVKGETKWTQHAGPFDTEAEAKEQAEALIRAPVVGYNKDSILWKFENLKQLNKQTKGKINALSVTNEARKAGLDYRLVDPAAPDFAGSKLNLAVVEIKRIYDAWSADRGTQLVFCDLSTPKSARAAAATKEKPAYVRGADGDLRQVKATVAAIDGQPVAFLVVKEKAGQFVVHDGLTGAPLPVRGTSRDEAVNTLRGRLATGSSWVDAERERFAEIDADAIASWKARQETGEDSTEEEDDGISVGDLMAMGGSGSKFSVYDDVKTKLVAAGIPEGEIAFIHDFDTAAKKNELYKRVRSGEVRVLLGSTEKMGAGTNVQERLVGLHHLDAPWRPSDLEQREGRIVRQGNALYERDPDGFEVELLRYATRQTYDTRMWQLIEHKAAGIEQLRKADSTVFEIEDIGGEEANAADMKAAASGNPLILDEIKLRNEVRSLEAQQYAHQSGLIALQDRIRHARGAPARAAERIAGFKDIMTAAAENPAEPFAFAAGTRLYKDKKEAATPLMEAFKTAATATRKQEVLAGQYRGVAVFFEKSLFGIDVRLEAGDSDLEVTSYGKTDTFSPAGLFTRIDNLMASLPARERQLLQEAKAAMAEVPALEAEKARPFARADDLVERRAAHRKVMNQLAKAGGGIELTPPMQRELKAAIRARLGTSEQETASISPAVRGTDDIETPLSATAARVVAEQSLGAIGITNLHRPGILDFVDTVSELSPAQQDWIEQFEAENPGRRIVAFVDHSIGRAYVIAGRVRAADIPGLVMHEIGAHYGLPAMIGASQYRQLLNEVRLLRKGGKNPGLNAAWDHVATHYGDLATSSDEFAAEVIARLSETEAFRALPLWRRVLSAVRQFLFRVGLTRVWNLRDEDIGQMVAAALRRTAVAGAVTPTVAGEVARAQSGAENPDSSESPLYQALETGLSKKGGAAMFRSMIAGMARRKEVEPAELDASGLMDWLPSQGASMTRDDVLDHLVATGSGRASMAVRAGDRMVPLTELEAPEWKGTANELLDLAKAVYTNALQGSAASNEDLGSIAFSAEGKGEAFHPIRHPIDAQVVEALRALVSNAALLESNPPRRSREGDTAQFHVMVAPLRFNGRYYAVKITIREAAMVPPQHTPMKFYDVAVLQKELPPVTWDSQAAKPEYIPLPRGATPGISLRQLAEIVKPGMGSQFSAAVRGPQQQSHAEHVENEAWRKAGLTRRERSLRERIEAWAGDRWEAVKGEFLDQFQTGMFDRFRPIRDAEGDVDAARSGYVSARLSTGSSATIYGMMMYGAPELRDGVIQKKEGSRGLLQILEPVAGDLNRWALWMVGKRADMLASQQRENNFTLEEIAYMTDSAGDHEARFEAVAKEVRAYMTDILVVMQKSGLLTASQVEEFSKDAYYLPFYRVSEDDGESTTPYVRRGLSHQASHIKRLKGGTMELNDPIENLLAHISRSIDASMKNHALLQTIPNTARHLTMAKEGDRDKAVRVMWGGKAYWYNVDEPALLRALTAVGEKPSEKIVMKIGRSMRSLLTTGITLDPAFMARNFIRDSMHSWLIDKNAMRFGTDSIRGAGTMLRTMRQQYAKDSGEADPAVVSMIFAGASFIGGYVYGGDPRASAAAMRKALKRYGKSDSWTGAYMKSLVTDPAKFWHMTTEIGEAVENANRVAVFKASQAAGDSLQKSLYEAKDLMDFSLRGQWVLIQFFSDVLPFFNARLQGLYKLGREARRDPRVLGLVATRIAARGALMALASIALVAAYSGDDRYEELEEWDKDANWHFWVNGVHYRIPKPFELGLLFGTIPERIYRMAGGYDRFGEFVQSLGHGLVSTLAIDLRPQALRPAWEILNNKSTFRQRPIESEADEDRLPEDRFSASTSPTMVGIGKVTGLSPKKLEYAWNGYLGTLGTYALGMADSLVRVVQGDVTPAKRIEDYPIIGSFARTGPAWNTEYLTELYELSQEAEQTWKSVRARYDLGDDARAARLEEDKAGLLEVREMLAGARERLAALRRERDVVVRDPDMTPQQKREALDEIQTEINDTAKESVKDAEAVVYPQ